MSDEFLFDDDLLQEGLLSKDDAWGMFDRGEIEGKELLNYLAHKRQLEDRKHDGGSPFVVIFVVIACLACLLSCLLIYSP